MNVVFAVDNIYNFVANNNGLVALDHAMPAQGRLYVIYSAGHTRPVYVGTSANVQDRFNRRLAEINDIGVLPANMGNIFAFTVRVTVNGANVQPNNLGVAGGIDVENLLLRIYVNHYGIALRNTAKWNLAFVNGDAAGLNLRYHDPNGHVGGFAGYGPVAVMPGAGNY